MALSLSVVAQLLELISKAVTDVEAGIEQGKASGVVAEVVDVAEVLWQDKAFKDGVLALVSAIKA